MKLKTILKHKSCRYLLLLGLFIGIFAQYQSRAPKRHFSDFHIPYTVGQKILAEEEIYSFEKGLSYFKYPPFYANLMVPLSILSERVAANIWFVLNFIFLMILYHTSRKILVTRKDFDPFLLYAITCWVTFRVMLQNMQQGQANVFMLTLLTVGLYYFLEKRYYCSAFFIGFSIMTKYMPIFFLPYLLLIGQFAFLLVIIMFIALFNFVPVIAFGLDQAMLLVIQQLNFLFASALDPWSIYCHPNQSLLAFLARLVWVKSEYLIHILTLNKIGLYILFFAIGGLLYFLSIVPSNIKKQKIPTEKERWGYCLDWALIFICMPLLNPNGWSNFFICLIFPFMLVITYLIENKWKDNLITFMGLIAFASMSWPSEEVVGEYSSTAFEIFSSTTIGALMLFATILILKIKHMKS